MSVRIAPSILAADFAALGECIAAAERGGADLVHVDVMDGHFVPNLTVGPPVVRSLQRVARVPLDVHLMIEDPDRFIPAFIDAGAALISVHVEVLPHLHRTIAFIKGLGAQAGVVLNPSTPVGCLEEVAADVDFVLLMTVNPGFGGQAFIPRSTSKIQAMRALLDEAGNPAPIEVDGGIDEGNVARVVAAGADWIVAGSSVFGSGDAEAATRRLKALAVAAAQERLAAHRASR
jgi:ribulose-phosphate 3-epimerase